MIHRPTESPRTDTRFPYTTLFRSGFRREFILGPGESVDFLVGDRIAVELKVKCSPRVMMRQLQRYAAHDKVQAIILVTATVTSMPDSMNGKPVYVVKDRKSTRLNSSH